MQIFNLSATLNSFRLLYNPNLALPHLTIKSLSDLPVPLKFPGHEEVCIKGIVLDKDNCFAKDKTLELWPEYEAVIKKLQEAYPQGKLIIVSNSSGTDDDVGYEEASELMNNLGIPVLRHHVKKPGCHEEILAYFETQGIKKASEIAVIGDRLFTDIVMANTMGSWGIWLDEGVEQSTKLFPTLERKFYSRMVTSATNPAKPPIPDMNP